VGKTEIIAYHGWGFDARCWNKWPEVFSSTCRFKAFNRGYYSTWQEQQFSADANRRVVFTHSFGLHLCPLEVLAQTDLLIVFSGFLAFHPQAAQLRRRSRLVLNQMIQQFEEHPQQVLHRFFENAYEPQSPSNLPQGTINEQLLLSDLKMLNVNTMSIQRLNTIPKICILHGRKDRIVPCSKGRELDAALQTNTRYFEVRDAGHAMPFTHVEQCQAFIESELAAVT
jgi:pimeloyl-[acyl-carrier protein] methyl ester esterase